jgi:ubiquinone/menaquinone biosynthesis C-methylase UbiE
MDTRVDARRVRAGALALAVLCAWSGAFDRAAAGPDDWEARWNKLQPADKVMDAVGIAPGMVVAEFGAGKGRYAVQVAARVGTKGMVYAEDIDESALAYIEERCERDKISNIETVLGSETDPRLPPASCDFVYCINTYHHVEDPVPLLRNIVPALKPGGRLVVIEHSPEKTKEDGLGGHATPPDSVMAQARAAGYELVARHSFLELDEIYVFRAANKETPAEKKAESTE